MELLEAALSPPSSLTKYLSFIRLDLSGGSDVARRTLSTRGLMWSDVLRACLELATKLMEGGTNGMTLRLHLISLAHASSSFFRFG